MNPSDVPTGLPTHDTLAGLVGQEFPVDDRLVVRLDEVTAARTYGDLESFSMYFSGAELTGQGVHRLSMPGHGTVDVFLVAVAPGLHEATVTRTVSR